MFMEHYLSRMCQYWLQAVLWSHIGILMRLLAAQLRSTSGILLSLSVSLWNDLADPVIDAVGLAGFMSNVIFFHWPKLLAFFFPLY